MDWIKIAHTLFIFVFLLSTAGCIQASSEKNEIFTTYSHPATGFVMKYPQNWDINHATLGNTNQFRVIFSSPDNQASFRVDILSPKHIPEGEEEGGIGLGYDVPNSTIIDFMEPVQLAGIDGVKWTFLVKNPEREYYDKFICITQKCPLLQNNRITYCFNYDYGIDDEQMEKTLQAMLDSINLTCPSED